MISIGICDDLPEAVQTEKEMIQRIADRLGLNMEIHTFRSGEELLQGIQTYGHMDILLLDIEMEGKNGIETASLIRETDYQTVMIFISAYDQYCKEMIAVQPFAFLDKPVEEKCLQQILQKALHTRLEEYERYLFSQHKCRYSIPLNQILYFESVGRKIHMHCTENIYQFYGKLNAVEKSISRCRIRFARVQVSYLVNLSYIREWGYDRLVMDDGTEISISKKYRKQMKEHYMRLLERE